MKLKIKSKEELKAIAKDIFGRYKSAENVAVTSDGTAFVTDENDLAVKNHSVKNRYGKKLAIAEFTRDDFVSGKKAAKESDNPKKAKDLIVEIEAATDVDVVKEIAEAEKTGEKRKTVLDAAEAKLESLKTTE